MIKILVVDDSKFAQRVTASMIGRYVENAEFMFAGDGEEGIDKFKALHPDFLIIDLLMPKLRGQDLIEKIRQIDFNAKIIVLSADIQHRVRLVLDKMGILSFINKPINEEKAKKIASIIGNGAL
ncbi:MAG: response regulator [Sporolactobacillus sp.]|nr:response regulator [Sporolactobacillus sp.]